VKDRGCVRQKRVQYGNYLLFIFRGSVVTGSEDYQTPKVRLKVIMYGEVIKLSKLCNTVAVISSNVYVLKKTASFVSNLC